MLAAEQAFQIIEKKNQKNKKALLNFSLSFENCLSERDYKVILKDYIVLVYKLDTVGYSTENTTTWV